MRGVLDAEPDDRDRWSGGPGCLAVMFGFCGSLFLARVLLRGGGLLLVGNVALVWVFSLAGMAQLRPTRGRRDAEVGWIIATTLFVWLLAWGSFEELRFRETLSRATPRPPASEAERGLGELRGWLERLQHRGDPLDAIGPSLLLPTLVAACALGLRAPRA